MERKTVGGTPRATAVPGERELRMSVALCTYNGEAYLEEQLQSILKQSRLPDEVVICDDRSIDRTMDIVSGFAQTATFPVRTFVNQRNLGSTKNFEKAISLCKGNVIVLSDQDDSWYETRLSVLEKSFRDHPSLGLIFSDADLIDEESRLLGARYWNTCGLNEGRKKEIQSGRALNVLLRHNVVFGATTAFRAELCDILLPIPEIAIHDLWIALLASVVSEVGMLPTPLIKYRKHSRQQFGVLYYNVRESVAKAMKIGSAEYFSLASQYTLARDRIREHLPAPKLEPQVALIERKIRHMSLRAALPAARWKRFPTILRQTANLDYFRYSEGLKSVVKDLVRSTV